MFFAGQQSARHPLRCMAVPRISRSAAVVVSMAVSLAALSAGSLSPARVSARESSPASLGIPATVALSSLPFNAQSTYRLIQQGGPFPYPKDGVTFNNRERRLPAETRGYYREYTVRTPGADDRGARRIVCGSRISQKAETCYYTHDHYNSFQKIVK